MSVPSPPLARIAVRSSVWVGLGTYLNLIVGFVATLALTRILPPDLFGFLAMGLFWSALLNLRSKAGLNYAAVRRPRTDGALLGTYHVLDLGAGIGSLTLGVLAGLVLSRFGYPREVTVAVVVLMSAESVATLVSPLAIVLEKELQLGRLALVSLAAAVVAYAVAIALALSGYGLWSLLAISVVMSVASLAGVAWVGRRHVPQTIDGRWRFDPALARELLRQGLPTGLSLTALSSIVTQFDDFLIGTFVDYATLGLYDRAYRIAHWPNLLLTMIVSRVGFLTFVRVQDDPPRLTHAVRVSLWTLSTLGPPIALVLFFAAPDIVRVLYGARWSGSADLLRVLTIYSLVSPYVSIGLWLAVALAHNRTALLLTGAPALSLIVIGTPLTLSLGVSGTLIAVAATMLLAFALSCRYIFRQVPLDPGDTFAPPLIAIAVASGILLVWSTLAAWAQLPLPGRLVGTAMIGPGAHLLTLFALRREEMIAWTGHLTRAFGFTRPGW